MLGRIRFPGGDHCGPVRTRAGRGSQTSSLAPAPGGDGSTEPRKGWPGLREQERWMWACTASLPYPGGWQGRARPGRGCALQGGPGATSWEWMPEFIRKRMEVLWQSSHDYCQKVPHTGAQTTIYLSVLEARGQKLVWAEHTPLGSTRGQSLLRGLWQPLATASRPCSLGLWLHRSISCLHLHITISSEHPPLLLLTRTLVPGFRTHLYATPIF